MKSQGMNIKDHMTIGANGNTYRGYGKHHALGFLEETTMFKKEELATFIVELDRAMGGYITPTWSVGESVIAIDRRWHNTNNRFYIGIDIDVKPPTRYKWWTTYGKSKYPADTIEKCLSYMTQELKPYEDMVAEIKENRLFELELGLEYVLDRFDRRNK